MNVLTIAVASAYVQSVARLYPAGVNLVSSKRENLLFVSVQNRSVHPVYFWHGTAYENLAAQLAGNALPENPASWTALQRTNFEVFVKAYGEKIDAGATYAPNVAQRLQLYSFVDAATAEAHVKIGLPADPMTTPII